jgi:hypothetical protein
MIKVTVNLLHCFSRLVEQKRNYFIVKLASFASQSKILMESFKVLLFFLDSIFCLASHQKIENRLVITI